MHVPLVKLLGIPPDYAHVPLTKAIRLQHLMVNLLEVREICCHPGGKGMLSRAWGRASTTIAEEAACFQR